MWHERQDEGCPKGREGGAGMVPCSTGKGDLKEIIAFSFPPASPLTFGHFMEPECQRKWFGFGFGRSSSLKQIPVAGGAGSRGVIPWAVQL